MKFKLLIILSIGFILLIFVSCEESQEYEVTILNIEDYRETKLGDWINNCKQEDGYYQFINSDPDSWEMYVYICNYNKDLHYITYIASLEVDDSTIEIDINSEDALDDSQVMKDIFLHITAPMRGKWPSKSKLKVDGLNLELLESSSTY